jgi:hypothetical protein
MYVHGRALSICQLHDCNLFTQHAIFYLLIVVPHYKIFLAPHEATSSSIHPHVEAFESAPASSCAWAAQANSFLKMDWLFFNSPLTNKLAHAQPQEDKMQPLIMTLSSPLLQPTSSWPQINADETDSILAFISIHYPANAGETAPFS